MNPLNSLNPLNPLNPLNSLNPLNPLNPVNLLLLVNPHVIDFQLRRERRGGRVTAVGPTDGEVDQDVVRVVEGVDASAVFIHGSREIDRVQRLSIDGERNLTLVPVHPPLV